MEGDMDKEQLLYVLADFFLASFREDPAFVGEWVEGANCKIEELTEAAAKVLDAE